VAKDPLDDILNAPPPAVTPTQTQSNIGVPNDYVAPPDYLPRQVGSAGVRGRGASSESAPGQVRYKTGSELRPIQTPELIPQLQAQLVQAGLLDVKGVRPGVWDYKSQAAYRKVLEAANQMGLTAQEALAMFAANPSIGDQQGSSRAPNIIQETNPLDIAATAQEVAQKRLGRYLSEDDLKPFIAQFQSLERSAQEKAYTLGGEKGKGGVVVTPPTVQNSADDYYTKNYAPEEAGYAAASAMSQFYSLLNSPVSGAGNG
jgi:hypothetical protein